METEWIPVWEQDCGGSLSGGIYLRGMVILAAIIAVCAIVAVGAVWRNCVLSGDTAAGCGRGRYARDIDRLNGLVAQTGTLDSSLEVGPLLVGLGHRGLHIPVRR